MNQNSVCIILAILVVGTFAVSVRVQAEMASGTVYIRANGIVDPPTAPIITTDNVTYTFTGNLNDSIVVERDNVIVDGAGYMINGTNMWAYTSGMELLSRKNVTVENILVEGFYNGIYLYLSSNNSVLNNTVSNNVNGIWLDSSWPNNTIIGNNVTANLGLGIYLYRSSFDVLKSNVMSNNGYNFGVDGDMQAQFDNYVDHSNTVNSKEICYLVDQENVSVPTDAGLIALVDCTNITVKGLMIANDFQDIILVGTANSIIVDNVIEKSSVGIYFRSSSNNFFSENTITENSVGIMLYQDFTYDNNVSDNDITRNYYSGIWIFSLPSNNAIFNNNITYNGMEGLRIDQSDNNRIYHNNIVGNAKQVDLEGSNCTWDNGYPSGGNYWSDYNGTDVYSGPYQNETGFDWIGDTPYVIDQSNIDRYPLTQPFAPVTQEIRVIYRDLLGDYNGLNESFLKLLDGYSRLQMNFDALNQTLQTQLEDYLELERNYTSLLTSDQKLQQIVNSLNVSFNSLARNYTSLNSLYSQLISNAAAMQNEYNALNASYTRLQSKQQSTQGSLNVFQNVTYAITAMLVVLIILVVYLVVRKPKTNP